MAPSEQIEDRERIARLVDEAEQLRTALEASDEENMRLAEDRERLLRRLTDQARELQAANDAYKRAAAASADVNDGVPSELAAIVAAGEEQEELRVAFEELQVLSEELEVANGSLRQSNHDLDRRVDARTRELALNNAALTISEGRFRTLAEGIPQLVWRAVDGGQWTWASPQWEHYTGRSNAASAGLGWLDAVHPDDRSTAMGAWQRAAAGAPLAFEVRILHAVEGRHRHFQVRASPVRGEAGEVIEWLGTSTDVDDLIRLQHRQQVLLAELQHRVRNILTVVRAVFGRTMDAGGDASDLADHFRGRLDSLARTQVVVTASASGHVDLEDLIRDELLSVGASDGAALHLDGPDVALSPKAAESIGLAVHELTTNALKYGALKVPGATLTIEWQVRTLDSGIRRLDLKWTERGVPAIDVEPARRGFGTELIIEALPYRLGAETKLEFRGGGVRCTICVPLPDERLGPATLLETTP